MFLSNLKNKYINNVTNGAMCLKRILSDFAYINLGKEKVMMMQLLPGTDGTEVWTGSLRLIGNCNIVK